MFLPVFVSYTCACVQHLQEGRKAQQYLDQCWKQMDNVSVAGGRSRHRTGGKVGVWCKYSVSNANGSNSRPNEGSLFHKYHLAKS